MDYETKIQNGHKFIVGHFFKAHEIQIGSRWIGASGSIVTVEGLNTYGSIDPWIEVVYSWEENGVKKTHDKGVFSFQCRYCLIVEDT
jgi:hypothetical protein